MATSATVFTVYCPVCGLPFSGVNDTYKQHVSGHESPDVITWLRGDRFAHRDLNPESSTYVTVEDRVRVLISTSVAAVEVDVAMRIQLPDGQIIPILKQFFPTSARAVNIFEFDLCEGFLLSMNVTTPTAAVRRGGCFADIALIRSTGTNAISYRSLMDGYVITNQAFGWPDDSDYAGVEGPGLIRSVQVANPGAGADWSTTVPVGARWELLALNAQFATSAAVAARVPQIQLADNVPNVLFNGASSTSQAASLTYQYSAAEGGTPLVNAPAAMVELPHNALLLQGWTIRSVTTAIQGADQWSNIWLMVQEWLEF